MSGAASPAGRGARVRGWLVLVGLLLTFAGLLGVLRLLPSPYGEFSNALPYAILATLGLWLGGLLLGLGKAPRSSRGAREAR